MKLILFCYLANGEVWREDNKRARQRLGAYSNLLQNHVERKAERKEEQVPTISQMKISLVSRLNCGDSG